jgi:glycosyltransferase involved in cell wall biosynthesis
MTRPRLLYVDFAPEPGGSIQSLLLLLRHLDRDRFDPLVLLSPAVAQLPAIVELGLPVFGYDAGQGTAIPRRGAREGGGGAGTQKGRLRQWVSIARRLWLRTRQTAGFIAHLIDQHQVDLVHLNDALPLAEAGILAAWRRHRPSLVTVRSFTPLDPFHRLISPLPALGIVTSAALGADQIRQGARFRRQIILANAIDLAPYAAPPDRSGVRAELGLPPGARLAAVVGRLMRRKGIDTFIRALAQAAAEFPDLHGLIVGQPDFLEPEIESELRGLAEEMGAAGRLHFTGYREDIPRLLLAADLLCFVPAQPEPFGRTVIEAMAAGLPVITAATGALPDLVSEGKTGLLVPPADPAALAAALRRLLAAPGLAAEMGQAGRSRASERFGIEQQAAALAAIYETLLLRRT